MQNIKTIIINLNYLKDKLKKCLLELLQKYEKMFDGTLGKYTGPNYTTEFKKDVKPCHAKPFPIPKTLELNIKKEVYRLIKIGVLKKINNSQWTAPTFIITKINAWYKTIYLCL